MDLPLPRARVFEFFADARNLPRTTPRWLGVRIRTPSPIEVRAGAIIDYTVRWMGLPLRWRTLIEVFEPPLRFVDVQVHGPYRLWRHTHGFTQTPTGTRIEDLVEYRLPLGWLGRAVHAWSVRRQLARIFAYRRDRIGQLLAGAEEAGTRPPPAGSA